MHERQIQNQTIIFEPSKILKCSFQWNCAANFKWKSAWVQSNSFEIDGVVSELHNLNSILILMHATTLYVGKTACECVA